jgi:hypothetical protein
MPVNTMCRDTNYGTKVHPDQGQWLTSLWRRWSRWLTNKDRGRTAAIPFVE